VLYLPIATVCALRAEHELDGSRGTAASPPRDLARVLQSLRCGLVTLPDISGHQNRDAPRDVYGVVRPPARQGEARAPTLRSLAFYDLRRPQVPRGKTDGSTPCGLLFWTSTREFQAFGYLDRDRALCVALVGGRCDDTSLVRMARGVSLCYLLGSRA